MLRSRACTAASARCVGIVSVGMQGLEAFFRDVPRPKLFFSRFDEATELQCSDDLRVAALAQPSPTKPRDAVALRVFEELALSLRQPHSKSSSSMSIKVRCSAIILGCFQSRRARRRIWRLMPDVTPGRRYLQARYLQRDVTSCSSPDFGCWPKSMSEE